MEGHRGRAVGLALVCLVSLSLSIGSHAAPLDSFALDNGSGTSSFLDITTATGIPQNTPVTTIGTTTFTFGGASVQATVSPTPVPSIVASGTSAPIS